MEITIYHWIVFLVFLVLMLVIDLGVFNKKSHTVSNKEALLWSAVWIALALIFNAGVYWFYGHGKALEFLTGYLLEKSLSVDNLFIFVVLFGYFNVPKQYQHKVLYWGIIGAIIMRGILIVVGTALITKFSWIIYIFGGFLVITGFKMAFSNDEKVKPDKNPVVKLFKKFFPIKPEFIGDKFFVKENLKLFATPLFIVLIIVESTDLIFAFDSIPAILAITQDPFIVFTSNAFAILGLRALYFVFANFVDKFRFLKYGLAIVLVYIGIKMLISGFYHIPTLFSLSFLVVVLSVSVLASLTKKK